MFRIILDLCGITDEEKKATEDILNTTEDTWNKMSKFFWEKDPAKKARLNLPNATKQKHKHQTFPPSPSPATGRSNERTHRSSSSSYPEEADRDCCEEWFRLDSGPKRV